MSREKAETTSSKNATIDFYEYPGKKHEYE